MSPHSHGPTDPAISAVTDPAATQHAAPGPQPAARTETNPEIVARLEWLDDLMFAAIDGDATSLETAADAWKKLLEELGVDTLEESRRQYLRRAQTVWNDLRHQPNHPPHKVFAAIEVISLLAGKAW